MIQLDSKKTNHMHCNREERTYNASRCILQENNYISALVGDFMFEVDKEESSVDVNPEIKQRRKALKYKK